MRKLIEQVEKIIENERLDHHLQAIIANVSWDDLMLAFANVCVFKGNTFPQDGKEYRNWFKRANTFYDCIIDTKKATVQKRKIKKQNEQTHD